MSTTRALRYIGWLLRVNRRLGHDRTLRSGREFARAFRVDAARRPLAPSQITRWENGELGVSRATIRRYEHLLGLPAESLATLGDSVVRAENAEPARPDPDRCGPDERRGRLFDLLDRATGRTGMTGATWSELTELIAAQPQLELYPPKLWRIIADRLVTELVVAVDSAWLQRQEAMSRLLEHPAAGRHAIAACVDLAANPASPAVVEPLSLLDVTPHPDANRYVLAQLDRPDNERALHGALLAAARKVNEGHFHNSEWTRLARSIRAIMTDSTTNQTLLPLVHDVDRAIDRRLHGERGSASGTRSTSGTHTRDVSSQLGALAQGQLAEEVAGTDQTLCALIEECLFDPNPDHRMIAGMLIAATPYRVPVATAIYARLLANMARRAHGYPATAALRTLTQLNVDIHRPLIQDILVRPGSAPTMRYAAAWATPHCPGRHPVVAWRQMLATQLAAWQRAPSPLSEGVLQGIAYGIGTDRHQGLLAQIRDDPIMPGSARTTAAWMLDMGASPA